MTDNTQSEVVAYFYESKITSKHGSASWDRQLRDSHPETITNINYRNLQRLIPASESSKDLKTIGFQYELHGENGVSKHLVRKDIRNIDRNDIQNIIPLVPLSEDVAEGPEPEPKRKRGSAKYFKGPNNTYYRVDILEDEAEQIVKSDGVIEPVQMWDVWELDRHNEAELTTYEDTPFSEPKFNHG
jgi:hypothetical protein